MKTGLAIVLLTGAQIASGFAAAAADTHATTFQSAGMELSAEELIQVEGMVWAMDFVDPDSLIFTLLSGELGLLDLAGGGVTWIDGVPEVLPVLGGGPFAQTISGGLFDVMVDPDYASNGFIYLAYVKAVGDGHALAVVRGTLRGNQLEGIEDLFMAEPAGDQAGRWGSRLAMDDKRYLYVALGDRRVPDNAQNLSNHLGKLLRLHEDGSIPVDNPFSGRKDAAAAIWSYGHRNPQGLAFHPETGELFLQEHGPDGGDEINLIKKGANYGWPTITYGVSREGEPIGLGTEQAGMEQPLHYYKPGIGPCGMAFYAGEQLPGWNGSLFNGSLSRMHLNRLSLDGYIVAGEERLFTDWRERFRDVAQGPDGWLYLSTDSGRIIRITRPQE